MDDPNQDEDLIPPDSRRHRRLLDSRRQADGELSDSDDEGEGGRRDHGLHRDPDSTSHSSENDIPGGRKFGMGVGIMTSGQTTTHGAGPSGHATVARILSNAMSGPADTSMDVDTPSTDTAGVPPEPEEEAQVAATASGDISADTSAAMVVDSVADSVVDAPTGSGV